MAQGAAPCGATRGPTTVVHGPTGFGTTMWSRGGDPQPGSPSGRQYIVETVKAHRRITLVTIGPLTNLALALEAAGQPPW